MPTIEISRKTLKRVERIRDDVADAGEVEVTHDDVVSWCTKLALRNRKRNAKTPKAKAIREAIREEGKHASIEVLQTLGCTEIKVVSLDHVVGEPAVAINFRLPGGKLKTMLRCAPASQERIIEVLKAGPPVE